MATTPTVYVICDQNCKFEGMTKEQIFTAIMQAVSSGVITDIDAGFVTTIKTINGVPLKFFVGEQAAYDSLSVEEKKNVYAIITNDTTKEGIIKALEDLDTFKDDIKAWREALSNGEAVVPKAKNAINDGDGKEIAKTYLKVAGKKYLHQISIMGSDISVVFELILSSKDSLASNSGADIPSAMYQFAGSKKILAHGELIYTTKNDRLLFVCSANSGTSLEFYKVDGATYYPMSKSQLATHTIEDIVIVLNA